MRTRLLSPKANQRLKKCGVRRGLKRLSAKDVCALLLLRSGGAATNPEREKLLISTE